jgi:branched-subunit amino acid aminotransferase/4-amino-4-deoxychorismate lyase
MIWVGGRVVPDDELRISVLDRTFEHGLGLFETFRTWDGHPTLLPRHLERMTQSALALGLPLDPAALPNADAVAALLEADRVKGDALLRITLSGGLSESGGSTVWMRSGPLPAPPPDGGIAIAAGRLVLAGDDPLTRHKTLNYWPRRLAFEEARRRGFDEVLARTPDGRFCEGSRTNLFLIEGETLRAPSRAGPILPGVMRGLVLEQARRLPLSIDVDAEVSWSRLGRAEEVFLTNSVRGILPVARAGDLGPHPRLPGFTWSAPGPWTQRLWGEISDWLRQGGTRP